MNNFEFDIAGNTPNEPVSAEQLFNTEALAGFVVVCAGIGPKIPVWLGD